MMLALVLLSGLCADARPTVKIDDLVEVQGIRENQLTGVGLVVGLNGTGDNSTLTKSAVANLLSKMDIHVKPNDVGQGNVAMVQVTATLPANMGNGGRIDVVVSAMSKSSSLSGGQLVQAPLFGVDGHVYAVAQGPVIVGGFSAQGQAGSITQNTPTVGRIPRGALVERTVEMPFVQHDSVIVLQLKNPDLATASRIAAAIQSANTGEAHADDAGSVRVLMPAARRADPVGFLAEIKELRVTPNVKARVVINESTGTLVAGGEVTLSACLITHGNLTITVSESPVASQPAPFSQGKTEVLPRTDIKAEVETRRIHVLPDLVRLADLAEALNALGATPRDLVVIFQALQKSGVLNAEIVLM
ncbi:MAG: flagellar basal body P-ring protein FlgI [Planctomycetota bacterium]